MKFAACALSGIVLIAVPVAAQLPPGTGSVNAAAPANMALGTATPARTSLTVCLQANDPPLSIRGGGSPGGFALALSRTVAQRLDRDLRIQWFVSRDDPDANLPKDANALLSYGRCQLLAEYPLSVTTLKRPYAPAAKLPPFDGATPDDRHRWIKLSELTATRPYRLDALTVVLATPGVNQVRTLADLDGLKIGVQIATLPDAIAMHYDAGRLIEHVVHLPDMQELFERLQSGKIDAGFVELRAFDAWRLRHGSGGVVASGYLHSLGFNMGFVGLAADKDLVQAVDAVLADLEAHDAIAPVAAATGLTLVAPRIPAVLPDVKPNELAGD